jgi:hypothetical protein
MKNPRLDDWTEGVCLSDYCHSGSDRRLVRVKMLVPKQKFKELCDVIYNTGCITVTEFLKELGLDLEGYRYD